MDSEFLKAVKAIHIPNDGVRFNRVDGKIRIENGCCLDRLNETDRGNVYRFFMEAYDIAPDRLKTMEASDIRAMIGALSDTPTLPERREARQALADGVHPPNLLVVDGTKHELQPRHWQLACFMWGRTSATFEEIGDALGDETIADNTTRGYVSKLSTRLAEIQGADRYFDLSCKQGMVVNSKAT